MGDVFIEFYSHNCVVKDEHKRGSKPNHKLSHPSKL